MRDLNPASPLSLSVDPRLDLALHAGIDGWEKTVAERGATASAKWIMHRSAGADLEQEIVLEAIENLIVSEDPDDRALARAEVAEMVQAEDAELADVLWFAVRDYAISINDGDLLADATTHIAEIAFDLDEPTTAAEAWLDFLNWRREPDSASDPESVLTAFDEIIRAAEMDGARRLPPATATCRSSSRSWSMPTIRGQRSATGWPTTSRLSPGRSGLVRRHPLIPVLVTYLPDRSLCVAAVAVRQKSRIERNDLHGL